MSAGANSRSFRLIGLGRAGGSISRALVESGWDLVETLGRGEDFARAASQVEAVIIATPDDAIASVARQIQPDRAAVIHLSGAKTLDVLAPHLRRGSLHPLVSLPNPDIGARRLRSGVTMATAGDPITETMAADLGANTITVDEQNRVLYHATATIAANHLVVLAAQVESLARRLGLPPRIFWQLMTTTMENTFANGAGPSLTGPAARGDNDTIAAHIAALPPEERPMYQMMAERARELAERYP